MIDVRALRKTYPGGVEAVRDIDFDVAPGEVFGLLGPNGAGKSTTVGMLTTTIAPTGGSASPVKQAHDDLDQARHIVETGLTLYAGDDNLVLPFLELGGEGGICVHTHVWGPQTKEMVTSFKSGDTARAKALNDEMAPAFELLKIQTNPIPIKAAMNLLGHEVGGYRLPMVEPTDQELAQVRACLERAGVLQPARA
jgi:4-hydroxy-tetrahydrodipicolinate synthase